MKVRLLIGLSILPLYLAAAVPKVSPAETSHLKKFIEEEKPIYEARKRGQKDLISQLDSISRSKLEIEKNIRKAQDDFQEFQVSLNNLQQEQEKQNKLLVLEKGKLKTLYLTAYKIQRYGFFNYYLNHSHSKSLTTEMSFFSRLIKSRLSLMKELKERKKRFEENEQKLLLQQKNLKLLVNNLEDQKSVLKTLSQQKRTLIARIGRQQSYYESMMKKYEKLTKKIESLFAKQREAPIPLIEDSKLAKLEFLFPVEEGILKSKFGHELNKKFGTSLLRNGIEIEAKTGAKIVAVESGSVEFVENLKGIGAVMVIKHGPDTFSVVGHLMDPAKRKGDLVSKGDILGVVGEGMFQDKPSLYLEIHKSEKAVDPLTVFSKQTLEKALHLAG